MRSMNELEQIREECRKMVQQRALVSGAVAVVPIPGLDVGADVAIMSRMIDTINERFGLNQQQISTLDANTKQRLMVIISSLGSSLIGKYLSKELIVLMLKRVGVRMVSKQAAKFVPLLGSALAAGISYGAMRMLGNAHIEDCYRVLKKMHDEQLVAAG